MTTATDTSLKLTRLIQADAAKVFDAWTQPQHLNLWSAPEGMDVEAEVDLSVGGKYRIRMKGAEGEFNAVGEYLEIDRPNRLRYTWSWEEEGNDYYETVVTVEFHDLDGATAMIANPSRMVVQLADLSGPLPTPIGTFDGQWIWSQVPCP